MILFMAGITIRNSGWTDRIFCHVSARESEGYRYIFVQNFNGEEVALEFPEEIFFWEIREVVYYHMKSLF
jgi:hypothetical protein